MPIVMSPLNASAGAHSFTMCLASAVAAFGSLPARLAVRGYTRSIITAVTEVDLDLGDLSLGAAVIVPLIVAVVALALSSARLSRLEVA